MAKRKKKTSITKILGIVAETLKFHLTESGGKLARDREIPICPHRPGSITQEYLDKIRKERLEVEKKLNARYEV